MIERLRAFFADPGRQALGWAGLGILGIVLAAIGLWMYSSDGGSPVRAQAESPTPRPSASPSASPTATPGADVSASPGATASPTATPTVTATLQPASQRESSGAETNPAQTPDPPAPTPTAPPVVAAGDYCDTSSGASPATVMRIAGTFTVGGNTGPAGKTITLLFDGAPGPSGTTVAGGYGITYAIGTSSCANRPGAVISLSYEGVVYPTSATVPAGNPGQLQIASLAAD